MLPPFGGHRKHRPDTGPPRHRPDTNVTSIIRGWQADTDGSQ